MIETICRILEMPLKDDKDTETIVVKNEDIHENDVLMGRGEAVWRLRSTVWFNKFG